MAHVGHAIWEWVSVLVHVSVSMPVYWERLLRRCVIGS